MSNQAPARTTVDTVAGALDKLNITLGGQAGAIPGGATKEAALETIYRTLGGQESLDGINTTSQIIKKIAELDLDGGGDGGDSDFSTAQVTLIGFNQLAVGDNNVIALIPPEGSPIEGIIQQKLRAIPNNTPFSVPLFKGHLYTGWNYGEEVISINGNAEPTQNVGLHIFGDCTLTYTPDTPA